MLSLTSFQVICVTFTSSHHTKNYCRPVHCGHAFSLTFITLIALLPPLSVAATKTKPVDPPLEDARWFQVELILFAQQSDDPLESEQWPDLEGLSLPDSLLELHLPLATATATVGKPTADSDAPEPGVSEPEPPTDAASANSPDLPPAYQILGDDALQLTDMVKKLRRSSRFKPLLHVAWQQPTYDRQHSQPIFFMEGMTDPLPAEDVTAKAGLPPTDESQPAESLLPPMLEYASEEDTKIGPPNPQFVGTITLSVERYLHLASDLIYRQPVTQHTAVPIPDLDLWYDRPYATLHEPQGPAYQLDTWQAMRGFRLKESRRMRSTEIHYLDNPFMGLVVVITPVELPEPAEEIQQTSPLNILSTPGK